jgi:hypothetical protein
MALEETTICDKIEVLANGAIQVRQRQQILKDGNEVAANFSRYCLCPGDDLDGQDPRVVAIAAAVWTPECIAAYQAAMATEPESDATADEPTSGLSSFQPTSTTTKA